MSTLDKQLYYRGPDGKVFKANHRRMLGSNHLHGWNARGEEITDYGNLYSVGIVPIERNEFLQRGIVEISHEVPLGPKSYYAYQTDLQELRIEAPTLELLTPFVSARIQLISPHGIGQLARLYTDYKFAGDSTLQEAVGIWEETELGGSRVLQIYRLRDVRPLLRTFAHLVEPLPRTGEIPAIHVMQGLGRVTKPGEVVQYRPPLTEDSCKPTDREVIRWMYGGKPVIVNGEELTLKLDDTVTRWCKFWVGRYLQGNGFAVALREFQFIPAP